MSAAPRPERRGHPDPLRASRRRVPEVAVYVAAKRLEEPSDAEGFDSLNHVRIVGPSDYEIIGLPPP